MKDFATFWQRLMAMVVDLLVFLPLAFLQAWIESASKAGALAFVVLSAVFGQAYTIYGHGRFGRTVEKWVMEIRVVRVSGEPLRWREAWLRSAVDLCSASVTGLWA